MSDLFFNSLFIHSKTKWFLLILVRKNLGNQTYVFHYSWVIFSKTAQECRCRMEQWNDVWAQKSRRVERRVFRVLWVEERFHAFFCFKNVEESHEGINNVDLFFYWDSSQPRNKIILSSFSVWTCLWAMSFIDRLYFNGDESGYFREFCFHTKI